MPFDRLKGHAALRRGRNSAQHATYFLTLCTTDRRSGLDADKIAETFWFEATALDADRSWRLRCAVLMPDHVHLVIELGERLTLAQCVQRLKAKTSRLLHRDGLGWERGFYDRRLRENDSEGAVFLYVFLNPYRAELVGRGEKHSQFRCCPEDWVWFQPLLEEDLPVPEWLDK